MRKNDVFVRDLSMTADPLRNTHEYPYTPYIFRNQNHRPTFCRLQYQSIFIEIFLVGSGNFVYFCKSDVSAVQGHPRSLM